MIKIKNYLKNNTSKFIIYGTGAIMWSLISDSSPTPSFIEENNILTVEHLKFWGILVGCYFLSSKKPLNVERIETCEKQITILAECADESNERLCKLLEGLDKRLMSAEIK